MADAPKILIVDDQRAVREELAFALGYEGFATAEAADGDAGLAAAKEPQVAMVLLDVKMPGLDGLEVRARRKADRPARLRHRVHAPVEVVTAEG